MSARLGRWPPAAVQALEHLDEVDRLAAQLVPIVAHHLEEAEDERGLVLVGVGVRVRVRVRVGVEVGVGVRVSIWGAG